MALVIQIAGTNRTDNVEARSLKVKNVLTNNADTCEFTVRKFGTRTYEPSVNDEVIITQSGTRIFGGHIMEIEEEYRKLDDVSLKVKCVDYTKHMDQRLVVDSYEEMTVAQIIADLRETYMPKDIDISNAQDVSVEIKYIAFNYESVSDCLRQLAEVSNCDWYIDYNKNLYFFQKSALTSPFNLTDTGGKYIYESLRINRDLTQLRNVIYVRGGEFLGNTITANYQADGVRRNYFLPHKFSDISLTVTGQVKSLGVDPIDPESNYDALHNFQEKVVKFREDKKPSSGSTVKIIGRPHLPVITKMRDPASMNTFTAREFIVIDRSIQSKEGARQRAMAELLAYKTTIAEGEFRTYESGLKAGQKINIQSDLRGLDEDFYINKVETQSIGTDASDGSEQLIYRVSLITTRSFDYINLLQRLLNQKKKEIVIADDEVLDVVESVDETISFAEVVSADLVHNPISESVSLADTTSFQLNKGTQFVYGAWPPSGIKRIFVLNGSRLG